MDFDEAANTLFALRRFGSRPGTDATADLLAHLDDPQANLTCVQIAGTNGKGSTARMLESTLRQAGLSVGLYTSPHLDDISERIRVDDRPLREHALVSFVERAEPYLTERAAAGASPTFFETLTALALWEFDRQDVDVAVLEVGIGGRQDATSVVDPVASAVTSVALEHTSVLGDDIETIARDMAGVAPADRPLVTAATGDALAAVRETADEVHTVTDTGTDGDTAVTYGGHDGLEGTMTVDGERGFETRLALLGAHQARNAGVAIALARQVGDVVGTTVDEAAMRRGLRTANWPGRFEIVDHDPLVVLDGAHNPHGCACAADTLESLSATRTHLVVGALTDKDHRGMATALGDPDSVTICEPDHERAADAAVLARAFDRETDAPVSTAGDVRATLAAALDRADETDAVLVTGSLHTVAEARTRWTRRAVPRQTDSVTAARAVLDRAHASEPDADRVAESAVHRTRQIRVRPGVARRLQAAFRAVGGEAAVSNVADENREVVLTGTLGAFRALCDRLAGQSELAAVGADLRDSLPPDDGSAAYPWTDGTAVMGVLNVTPDSFHDGGEFEAREDAVARAEAMVAAGADIVDVGGESTRPGADPVPVPEERDRVLPVVEALADLDALVSVDTRKAAVARAALDAGADILNDVSGLADPEMRLVAAEYDVPVVVMHSIDAPVDPDSDPEYDDVADDVREALVERVLLAEQAGLDRSQIIVDPGVGFGKTAAESFELLARLPEFRALGCPILVGHSHKSMFEHVDREAGDRYEATVAATAVAARNGADIVRVHDVDANVAAVDVAEATREADRG